MSIFRNEDQPSIFREGGSSQNFLRNTSALYSSRLATKAAIGEADSYQDLDSVLSILEEEFETSGETGVRNRLARKGHERRLTGFSNFINEIDFQSEPEVAREAVLAAREVAEERPENRAPTSIETEYVDTLLSSQEGPAATADVSINFEDRRLTDVDFETVQRRRASRLEQIQQYLDGITEEREDRPWGMWFAERLGFQAVPGFVSSGQTGIIGEATAGENVFAGGRVREEAQLLNLAMATLTDEEWPTFLAGVIERVENATERGPFVDLTARQDILNDLIAPLPAAVTNSFNAVDNLLPVAGALVSGGRRIAKTPIASLRAVNRTTATEVAADQLNRNAAGGRTSMPDGDLANEILPTAINPEASADPSSAGAILRETETAQQVVETLPTTRLNPEELEAAINATRSRVEARYGEDRLVDMSVSDETVSTGQTVRNVSATLLTRSGAAFRSERSATAAARSMGLEPNIVNTADGGFGIQVTHPVLETGFTTTNLESATSTHRIASFALSSRLNAGQEIAAKAVLGEGAYNRYLRNTVTPTMKVIQKLGRRERNALAEISALGNNRATWYNRQQFDAHYLRLTSRDSSERSWSAYEALREMNDVEWRLRNDAMYVEKQTQGFRTVSFDTPFLRIDPSNGRVLEDLPANQRAFNSETGEMVDELPDGFKLVQLEADNVFSDNGWPAQFVAVRRNAITEAALSRTQLNYRGGGHRMYQGEYFVKQARRRALPDGGTYLESPTTFIVGRTKREVAEWTDRMESARRLYNEMTSDGLAPAQIAARLDDEIFMDQAGTVRGSKFVEDVQRGRIAADEPFEVVLDRELPSAYQRSGDGRFSEGGTSGFESLMQSQGRMYYSRRSDEAREDYMGNDAPTVDFGEMMNMSLQNVARLSAFSDFKTEMMTRWVNTYSNITEASTRNPSDLFFNGKVSTRGVDSRIAESAEAQRRAILNAMHFREDGIIDFDVMQRQLTDWVADQDWLKILPKVKDPVNFAAEMKNWFRSQNPQATLMGAAFDLKLGLFNIAQIPLQMSHLAAVWQLSKAGTRYNAGAFVNSTPSWIYSMKREGAENLLDHLVSIGMHKTLGLPEAEYRTMMQKLKTSGFNDVGGTHNMIAELGARQTINGAGGAVRAAREMGRTFFTGTEGSMRSSSWMVAWKEIRDEFPRLSVDSPEFSAKVIGRANDYAGDMTRATSAQWQRGALAIPTQFWGYFARMLEAMTSNKFSRAQRARLVLGQSFMFGVPAGIPFVNLLSEAGEPTGDVGQLNTFRGLIERGMLDHAYLWMTGKDTLISERIAPGAFAGDFIKTLFGESPYGPVSAGEILGGASFSIWLDTLGDATEFVEDAVRYLAVAKTGGTSGLRLTGDSFMRMARNISTVNNGMKAYMIHRYGILESSSGNPLLTGLDPSYSFEAIFSFNPGDMKQLSAFFDYEENREENVKEIEQMIRRYNTLVVNDPDSIRDYAAELEWFLRGQRADYVDEARQSAGGQFEPLFNVLQRRVDEGRIRAEAADQIEENQ